MSRLAWFSGVLFKSTLSVLAEAIEEWWDDFLNVWGLFDPEFRAQWVGEQRSRLDADEIAGTGGNFEAAGTGGQD